MALIISLLCLTVAVGVGVMGQAIALPAGSLGLSSVGLGSPAVAVVPRTATVSATPAAEPFAAYITAAARKAAAKKLAAKKAAAKHAAAKRAAAKRAAAKRAAAKKAAAKKAASAKQVSLAYAEQLLAAQVAKYPMLAGTTIEFGDAWGYQAVCEYCTGRIIVSKKHTASLAIIVIHEVWHVIDWRDNGHIDWKEAIPPKNAADYVGRK
jgi:hypothetical protein